MAQVINTNIQSLTAQRNLNQTGSALQQSIQRLSSGLRINSAKDDAAGLAISERFTTQIRGLNQAVRNANDGISLAQTGEGGISEITNNLQRIRELAVQSVNATNSESDRVALNLEVSQRLAEIDRIASQTSFNGRKILDGSFGNATFQVGANVGETIGLTLDTSIRTAEVGATATSQAQDLSLVVGNVSGDSGTYNTATSQALDATADGQAFRLSVGGVTLIDEQQTNETADAGAYTAANTGANAAATASATVTVSLADASGTDFQTVAFSASATGTDAAVSGADLDTAFDNAVGAGTLAGFERIGSFAGGDLEIVRTDGQRFTATMTTTFEGDLDTTTTGTQAIGDGNAAAVAASTDGADLAGGVTSGAGPAISVTAANIDAAVTNNLDALNAAGISVSGTAVGKDLVFSRADGESFDIVLLDEFTGLDGGFDTDNDAFGSGANFNATGTLTINNATSLVLDAGDLTLQIGDGSEVDVIGSFGSVQELLDGVKETLQGNASATLDASGVSFSIVAGDSITITGSKADEVFALAEQSVTAAGSLEGIDVLTAEAANDVLNRVDSALTQISELRSTFGAIQNRFESTITNLTTVSENLSASRSRIRDADFAAETAALTQAQILQQAGIAALSQANAQPQNVLALLQ